MYVFESMLPAQILEQCGTGLDPLQMRVKRCDKGPREWLLEKIDVPGKIQEGGDNIEELEWLLVKFRNKLNRKNLELAEFKQQAELSPKAESPQGVA